MTKSMQGIEWAGTGTPEELIQVKNHLQDMIKAGYSFRFMESYLMQCGYPPNMIRRMFHYITGITAEDAVNYKYIYSPGNIPGINLGWGYAKKGKDVYFIMPITNWYVVFCQKDDRTRVEVSKFPTIMEAVEAMEKLVKNVERWDPPVKEVKTKLDVTQLYKQPQLFMHAAEFRNVCDEMSRYGMYADKKVVADRAYANGIITKAMHETLLVTIAERALEEEVTKETLRKKTDDAMTRPADKIPETPQQFYDQKKSDANNIGHDDVMVRMTHAHVQKLSDELRDFDLAPLSTVVNRLSPDKESAKPSGEESDVMHADAWVAVELMITDKANHITKKGFFTAEFVDGDLVTKDIIKGVDNEPYSPTDESMKDYFAKTQAQNDIAQGDSK
jgi:hypothetical protein